MRVMSPADVVGESSFLKQGNVGVELCVSRARSSDGPLGVVCDWRRPCIRTCAGGRRRHEGDSRFHPTSFTTFPFMVMRPWSTPNALKPNRSVTLPPRSVTVRVCRFGCSGLQSFGFGTLTPRITTLSPYTVP